MANSYSPTTDDPACPTLLPTCSAGVLSDCDDFVPMQSVKDTLHSSLDRKEPTNEHALI